MHRPTRSHSLDWPPYPPTSRPTPCPRAPPTSLPLSASHPHPHSSLPHPLRERARTAAHTTRGVASALAVPPAPRGRNLRLPHSESEDGAELSESDAEPPRDKAHSSRKGHTSTSRAHGDGLRTRPSDGHSEPTFHARSSTYHARSSTYHASSSASSLLISLEDPPIPAFALKPALNATFPRFRSRVGRGASAANVADRAVQTPPTTPPADCVPDVLAAVARLEDTVAALRLELDTARVEIAELRAQVGRA